LKVKGARQITRGLRFRLTLSYALFFTLLLVMIGMIFKSFLSTSLDTTIRNSVDQDFAAMKGYLEIKDGYTHWNYDRDDDDEQFIVSRIMRVFMIANAEGELVQSSDTYASIGEDKPEEVRAALRSREAIWKNKKDEDGVEYLIRAGVFYSPTDEKHHDPYYIAIGRPLADSQRVIREFTKSYFRWVPIMIFGVSLLGWLIAGRALTPVTQVAMAAQRISGSNLTLRIPPRGAGDELDYLIETFNRMVERLESSFNQIRRFSTDVSHELRTPITAIRASSRSPCLRRRTPSSTARRCSIPYRTSSAYRRSYAPCCCFRRPNRDRWRCTRPGSISPPPWRIS
jgi:methyl-accepting chemotaxis protein